MPFECGEDVGTFQNLIERLRHWIETAQEESLGNSPSFGGRAWVHFRVESIRCHLNADTTRAGVAAFLDAVKVSHTIGIDRNAKGSCNKFVVNGAPIAGFYAYSDEEFVQPQILLDEGDA